MAKRAALCVVVASLRLVTAGAAWGGQQGQDAAPPLNPSESSCLGDTVGAACASSTTTAGGTCLVGCCCHFVTDPEGASTCAPCLACSDTSSLDPAFSPSACIDGGTLGSDDSGVGVVEPIEDAGGPVVTPAPPSTSMPSSGGCASARDMEVTPSMALAALAAFNALALFRRRARKAAIRLQRREVIRVQD